MLAKKRLRTGMTERLHKLMAQWGVASRRQAEQWIAAGRVRVNGAVATVGQKADPRCDRIEVDGRLLQPDDRPPPLYLLLNKPRGVVSTCHDPNQRRTVLDLVPAEWRSHTGLHPVGRLDTDSSGALLLTNDGDFTFALTHPSHDVAKTYRIWVMGKPPDTILEQWRRGVVLDGRRTRPATVERIHVAKTKTLLEVVLQEGRNRQIRRVAEQLGYPVERLQRIAIGSLSLQDLPVGAVRSLHPNEVQQFMQHATIPDSVPPSAIPDQVGHRKGRSPKSPAKNRRSP